jgi:peptide/nickel transport system permease protein
MTTYIIRRILLGLMTLILVTMLVFLLVRLLPGDPVMRYMAAFVGTSTGQNNIMTPEQHDAMMTKLGLDKPIPTQYWEWISKVIRGDLGESLVIQQPISSLIKDVLPRTAYIGLLMFIFSTLGGIIVGIYCALRRGTWLDNTLTTIANIGMTIPVFWLGILLIYVFSYKLGWFPMFGWVAPWDNFWKSCTYVVLPIASVSLGGIAGMARLTRSCMLEVMGKEYVRTAWAKGLRERVIVVRHQLKNAMIPVVTALGGTLGMILGGSVFIETVFSIPGMGRLMTQAIFDYDYQIVQATTLIFGGIVICSNLLVDIAWGWLDPRIRYS